jgi:large subunit ribosomal protein L6
MSRVAKAAIELPSQVEVKLEHALVSVKGPKGTLTQHIHDSVEIVHEKGDRNVLVFKPTGSNPKGWAHAGTARAVLNNMVKGVTSGFARTLELVGVGYRAQASKHHVTLSLGFSHNIEYALPEGVTAETPNNTTIVLHSIDKQLLGQVAAEIRAYRSPEPYKGKGVRYQGEVIVKKEAKKK